MIESARHLTCGASITGGDSRERDSSTPFRADTAQRGGSCDVIYIAETSEASLQAEVAQADAVLLCTQKLTAHTIAKARHCQIASRRGVGYDALDADALSAASIAVFANEPIPQEHPLPEFDQVFLKPHIGRLTRDAVEGVTICSVQTFLDFLDGTPDRALVANWEHVDVARQT